MALNNTKPTSVRHKCHEEARQKQKNWSSGKSKYSVAVVVKKTAIYSIVPHLNFPLNWVLGDGTAMG